MRLRGKRIYPVANAEEFFVNVPICEAISDDGEDTEWSGSKGGDDRECGGGCQQ